MGLTQEEFELAKPINRLRIRILADCGTRLEDKLRQFPGRLAQRESTRFTREGSLVQSQYRPPSKSFRIRDPIDAFRKAMARDVYLTAGVAALPGKAQTEGIWHVKTIMLAEELSF